MRLGELQGLRCQDVDQLHRVLNVRQQIQQLADGSIDVGPPKTDAGRRTISLPEFLIPEIERHLANFTAASPESLVFPNGSGEAFSRMKVYRAFRKATKAADLPPSFTIHDLTHTGNTLTATAGATTKELMARMGHRSPQAALRYQHATQDRDRVIAELLNDYVTNATPPRLPNVADGSRK